uniref:Cellulase n=1 Tax=uncultured bacterium contig00004 TaxID=1181496 RepID=A0A806KMG4_9BACT|nr:cellulase [uncultured bacterium contig00004]
MKKFIFIITLIILAFSLLSVSCPSPQPNGEIASEVTEYDPQALLDLPGFGVGVNIGNTLDSIGTNSWLAGETGWGNPRITKNLVVALKGHGYKTIRLPVTWAENIGPAPNYAIAQSWMDRVEEVVNWILEEDLYCILNLHHDGGTSDKSWILDMATKENETLDKYTKVWNQIALRFKNAPVNLILESMNEVGFDRQSSTEAYRKLNLLNQTFVDVVRASGGNNATRQLLIAGYWTDIEKTCNPLFKMPKDTVDDRLIVSVHYYTPSTFCIADNPDNSWGFRADWGTDFDRLQLTSLFNKLKTNFLDKGVPVVLGEYGVTKRNKDEESRVKWMAAVTQISITNGICPVLWDTGGEISRNSPYKMSDSLKKAMASLVF